MNIFNVGTFAYISAILYYPCIFATDIFTYPPFLVVAPVFYPFRPDQVFYVIVYGECGVNVTVTSRYSTETQYIGASAQTTFQFSYGPNGINISDPNVYKNGLLVTASNQSYVGVVVCADGVDCYSGVSRSSGKSFIISSHSVATDAYSYFAVSPYRDGTSVTITFKLSASGTPAYCKGNAFGNRDRVTFMLDERDVLFVYGSVDLTGSRVQTSSLLYPIAVFSGATRIRIPMSNPLGQGFMEQMIADTGLGKRALAFPIVDATEDVLYRTIASKPNTNFTLLNNPSNEPSTLIGKIGDFIEWSITFPNAFRYYVSRPVVTVQFQPASSTCPPTHTALISILHMTASCKFLALADFQTTVIMIIRKSNATYSFYLDDDFNDFTNCTPIDAHNKYVIINITVDPGVHTLTFLEHSTMMAAYVYGYGNNTAVSYHAASTSSIISVSHPKTTAALTLPSPTVNEEPFDSSLVSTLDASMFSMQSTPYTALVDSEVTPTLLRNTKFHDSPEDHGNFEGAILTSALSTMSIANALITSTTAAMTISTPNSITSASTSTTSTIKLIYSKTEFVSSTHHPYILLCSCSCKYTYTTPGVDVPRVQVAVLQKKNLGSYRRFRTSAFDNNRISAGLGLTAILVIALPILLIFVADLSLLIQNGIFYYFPLRKATK